MNSGDILNVSKSSDDHDDSGVTTAKATAMVVLFCSSTFFGLLPYKLSKWFDWDNPTSSNKSHIIIPFLLSFGGGVLLSTTFLHLLPEVTDNVNELQELGKLPEFSFHFSEFLMCIGFFAMYLVEECVHTYLHHRERLDASKSAANAFQRGINVRDSAIMKGKNNNKPAKELTIETVDKSAAFSDVVTNSGSNNTLDMSSTTSLGIQHHHHDLHHHPHAHEIHHSHLVQSHLPDYSKEDLILSSLRGLLIVLALSVHELFEGLAVGLEETESNVWYMFGAVSAHKLVLAFCVGVELVVNKTKFWLIMVYVITFAIVSPIGIGIGILLSSTGNSDASAVPALVLQGLATGTLLYVVFFEILSKTERSNLKQYAVVLLGFLIMFGLQFLTGHEHSHGSTAEDHDDHDHDHSEHDHIH